MPNKGEHRIIGTATGSLIFAGIELIKQLTEPDNKVDWKKVGKKAAIGGFGGFLTSNLPDILEPATSSQHRKIFHSISALAALGFGIYKLENSEIDINLKNVVRALSVGYASHLIADSETPRGLPLF